jgi:Flp pilus assembly protein TadD
MITQAQQGNLAEALRTCQAAVALPTATPAAHCRLGFVLVKLGKQDEARACFDTARALNPELSEAACLGMTAEEVAAILG